MSKLSRLLADLALGTALISGGAQAHAVLTSFKLEGHRVVLHFNGRVDAARSRLSLLNAEGAATKKIDCKAGQDQATLQGDLGEIAPGSYVVRWEVLSVDGHISRGDQPFILPAQ
jgi:methionine-rich copper-binding protein CopC